MRGRCAVCVGNLRTKTLKYPLQETGPGDDDPDIDHPQIEQQTEIVQVTVKERILVVPFDPRLRLGGLQYAGRVVPFADLIGSDHILRDQVHRWHGQV